MTQETTPETKTERSLKQRLKYPLALLVVGILALILYQTFVPNLTRVGMGEPLTHTPKADIKVLDELDEIEFATEAEVVDITNTLQTTRSSAPFPKRPIAHTASKTVIMPAPFEIESNMETHKNNKPVQQNMLQTAELLQTTLELAKQHSQQQVVSAKFHTLMGLVLNPTLSAEEQQAWAKLTLPLAEKMQATRLTQALMTLSADNLDSPTQVSETVLSTLPTWLAPFENLVTVRRIGTATPETTDHADNLAALRTAYQHYLMNESN